jgi:hypothetical protein
MAVAAAPRLAVDDNTVLGDSKGVQAAQMAGASQLDHLHRAFGRPADQVIAQLHDAVDHGVLRGFPDPHGAGDQEHRAVGGGGDTLQFVDEFIELQELGLPALCGREAIEDQDVRFVGGDFLAHQVAQSGVVLLSQRAIAVEIFDPLGNIVMSKNDMLLRCCSIRS